MLRRIVDRLTYANVVATLALFVALGGVSYAVTVPKRSVGAPQLKKNAVKSPKVKDNSLKSRDIRNNSLTHRDVRNGSLRGSDVRDGSLTGADVGDGSLTGTDVADGSLTGNDVRDGSLGIKDLGDLPAITPTYWAAVDGSGSAIRRGRGFLEVLGNNTGSYLLRPAEDLGDCAWVVTPGDTRNDDSISAPGPQRTVHTDYAVGGQMRYLLVEIRDLDGDYQNSDFSIAVFC